MRKKEGIHISVETQNAIIVVFCAVGLPMLALMWYVQRSGRLDRGPQLTRASSLTVLVGIIAVGGVLRVWLAATCPGYAFDIQCFRDWSYHAASNPLDHFYEEDLHCDYPPLYIYVLWILGAIRSAADLVPDGPMYALLLRLPAVMADLAIGILFWRAALQRWGRSSALMFCAFIVLNPAVIMNSAVWGQIDSILTLIVLGVIWLLYRKRYIWSAALFMLGFLLKPQCLFIGPVVLYAFIGHLIRAGNKKKAWLELAGSIGVALLLWFLVPMPFSGDRDPMWLVQLYRSTIGSYPYATFNAFNVYGFAGLNRVDGTESFFGGISAQHWGMIFAVAIVVCGAWLYYRNHKGEFLFVLSGFVWAAIFTLVHSMHERYLFAAPFFFLAGYLLMRDGRLLDLAVLFFGVQLVDASVTLYHYDIGVGVPAFAMDWMSLFELAVFCYAAWTIACIALHGTAAELPKRAQSGGSKRRGHAAA